MARYSSLLAAACFLAAVAAPAQNNHIVPASARNVITNNANSIPLCWTPTRFQSPYLQSELPVAPHLIRCIGFRHGNRTDIGANVDLEIWLGYTTLDAATITANYDSNFDVPSPAKVLVFRRKMFTVIDMETPNTDPHYFRVQIPLDLPFIWTPVAGRNLLVEFKVHGNSKGNTSYSYFLEQATSGTTRVYSNNDANAATGLITRNLGPVLSFDLKCKTTGTFDKFGTACAGTGGRPGVIVPAAMRTSMGNSNNIFGVAYANQIYHQIFDGSEVGGPRQFTSHNFRARSTYTGGQQTLTVKMGATKNAPSAISSTFASNATSPQTTVFNTTVNYPSTTANTDPSKFDINVPWTAPFLWLAPTGEHLLIEVVNTSAASLSYYPDAVSNTATSRCYGQPANATIGTIGLSYGLVMMFGYSGPGNKPPQIGNTGRPVIGKSFSVDVGDAKASTAAALLMGTSKTLWGAIPLPLDLTPLGAKGCNLLVSPDLLFGVVINLSGSGSLTYAIPNDVTLVGLMWHNQYAVLDQGANALGWAFSNGGTATVGEQ